jgi:hypothetical protein
MFTIRMLFYAKIKDDATTSKESSDSETEGLRSRVAVVCMMRNRERRLSTSILLFFRTRSLHMSQLQNNRCFCTHLQNVPSP